ncbi:MAG: anaerobic glycerol-3-phosphate dehydrogenase subunit A [Methanomassiliicoccales archaeon]|nr:anaerobic glycerol-3-phosphate dehydrogenase subunit A [Methanomassiliicoccales archaeon]
MARVEALVIGGGATGAGVARDLALRGVEVLLLERGDFCNGASGGNHGMLHSGARYAVKDPGSAADCASESRVLRRIAPYCIEDCGGVFVSLPEDDPTYPDRFERACKSTGVVYSPLTVQEARGIEPELSPEIRSAFSVNDASLDPFALVLGNMESARDAGAKVLNYKSIQSFKVGRGSIDEVIFRDAVTGEADKVKPEVVVNAAGAWAGELAAMARVKLEVQVDKGTMVVIDGRHTRGLVNRLRSPTNGDIVVPNHSSTIIGTTSAPMSRPGPACATKEDVQELSQQATRICPSLAKGRAVRAYAGIRALSPAATGRDASRGYQVVEHSRQGVDNLVSILGGKLTTYRLMAEKTADLACLTLGSTRSGRTAQAPLCEDEGEPHLEGSLQMYSRRIWRKYGPGREKVLAACAQRSRGTEVVCSCEQVLLGELEHFAAHPDVRTLSDLTRRTRAGMGYCQSGMCALQALSSLASRTEQDPKRMLEEFLSERWKGLSPVLEGDQLRQEVLKRYLLTGTYHLSIREGGC